MRWLLSGATFRAASTLARATGTRSPIAVASRAFSRVHDLLVAAILRERADLIYGGTTGALAAVAAAGRRSGTPFAVDFEDFHCAEHDDLGAGRLHNRLADRIMHDVLQDAAFVTAGSSAIAAACRNRFGRTPTPVNNTFRLPAVAPTATTNDIRFYWFSQTIGPRRGLEDVVNAAALVGTRCELHLRGLSANGYVDGLRAMAAQRAPNLQLHLHDPADPDLMIECCRPFTIGLATECEDTLNRALCLPNKALTYPLAGLPVVLTDTEGQRGLATDLREGGVSYRPGDVETLAEGLRRLTANPRSFAAAREASWEAARRRWHWEHAEERGALLRDVGRAAA